jgi:ATP adenylyltransferase/5',5'''-P-1,P-4-tetraphosphate phosphorylase II
MTEREETGSLAVEQSRRHRQAQKKRTQLIIVSTGKISEKQRAIETRERERDREERREKQRRETENRENTEEVHRENRQAGRQTDREEEGDGDRQATDRQMRARTVQRLDRIDRYM